MAYNVTNTTAKSRGAGNLGRTTSGCLTKFFTRDAKDHKRSEFEGSMVVFSSPGCNNKGSFLNIVSMTVFPSLILKFFASPYTTFLPLPTAWSYHMHCC